MQHTKEPRSSGANEHRSSAHAPLLYVDADTGTIHDYGPLAAHVRERLGSPDDAAELFGGLEIFLTQDADTQTANGLKRYVSLARDLREIFELVGRPYATTVQEGRADD